MWIMLSKKTEFLELEERRVWPWRVPENFLSISNVNSSLGSLSTKYMRCSTTEPRVSLKLEVKVCRIRWHMWVSLIVRGWGMWQPVLAVRHPQWRKWGWSANFNEHDSLWLCVLLCCCLLESHPTRSSGADSGHLPPPPTFACTL